MRPFEAEEYASRLERIQAGLTNTGLDGVLLTETANFEYVTGHVERVMWSSMTRILAVWVPAAGRPMLLVPTYVRDVAAEDTGWDVRDYDRIDRPPIDELVGLIRDGGGRRRIGLELAGESRLGMAATTLRALEAALPGIELVDGAAVLWDVRLRKSPAEIERLRRACAANTAAFGGGLLAAPRGSPRVGRGARYRAGGAHCGRRMGGLDAARLDRDHVGSRPLPPIHWAIRVRGASSAATWSGPISA